MKKDFERILRRQLEKQGF